MRRGVVCQVSPCVVREVSVSGTQRGAQLGAAVFLAGLSLLGPQAVGLASAVDGGAEDASVSAGSDQGRAGAQQAGRSGRVQRTVSGRPGGGGVADRAGAAPAAAHKAAVSEGSADVEPVEAVGDSGAMVEVLVELPVEPVDEPDEVVVDPVDPVRDPAGDSKVVDPVDLPEGGWSWEEGQPLPWLRGTDLSADGDGVVWAYDGVGQQEVVPTAVAVDQSTVPGAADVEQSIARLNTAVAGFFDAVSRLLSSMPANPVSELLSGALLLVRRGLFDQAPAVAPRVLVAEVLRPMTWVQDSVFSTAADVEVAGSLGAVDPEGAVLSYTLGRAPQFGAVRIDPDGTWTYTPDGTGTADEFSVVIDDGGWNIFEPFAAPTEVTVEVQPVSLSSSDKRGLIASDWLTVVKDTGEDDGDEPILLTVVMTTTLGVDGSTSVRLVDTTPNEIASNVGEGDRVSIPDNTGDTWIDFTDKFKPLSWDAVVSAGIDKKPVPVPLVLSVTLALDGDMTMGWLIGELGGELGRFLSPVGRILEDTELIVDLDDPGSMANAFEQAKEKIVNQITPTNLDYAGLFAHRFVQWALSLFDPDDPVGLGVTALIPVEQGFIENIENIFGAAGRDLRDPICLDKEGCKIARVDVISGGGGYAVPPTVTFEGGNPKVTATAFAEVIADDENPEDFVSAVQIIDGGAGYTSSPKVVFDGGPEASGAEAVAIFGGNVLDLNEQYIGSATLPVRTKPWDTDVELRFGLLIPPSDLTGSEVQSWTTTYAGKYVKNDWAEWTVETQAWPRITW